jgi:hypothetical protein
MHGLQAREVKYKDVARSPPCAFGGRPNLPLESPI